MMEKILLSAGHGGKDPGATGNGLRESELNLQIALACASRLSLNYSGHTIIMPRRDDTFVRLTDRRDIAERENVSLYVSIHNNSFNITSARGFETFISNGEVYEITELAQREIHRMVYSVLAPLGVPNRGMKRSNHWVTTTPRVPVVLVEYLFVSNPLDAQILKRQDMLNRLGMATADGIAAALNLPKKTAFDWQLPTGPLPPIQRRIGIEVNEIFANEVGYLVNNATYVKASYVVALCNERLEQAGLQPIQITGHGDHIKIKV
jgi:N-acetylmuramoyl-L-alanine amidase